MIKNWYSCDLVWTIKNATKKMEIHDTQYIIIII